jgi:hypothetical protein
MRETPFQFSFVMAGLVPAIHVLLFGPEDVDARHEAGHDDLVKLVLPPL